METPLEPPPWFPVEQEVTQGPGRGGDVTFTPGEEGRPDGSIIFKDVLGAEHLRLDPGGRIFVRGTEVDDDRKVYLEFRLWLASATVTKSREG